MLTYDVTNIPIFGFDVRVTPEFLCSIWSEERREIFLLKPNIVTPLSIDRHVWPPPSPLESMFTSGGNLGYWHDQQTLLKLCAAAGLAVGQFVNIALGLVIEHHDRDTERFLNSLLGSKTPTDVSDSWSFLGFDVADTGFISALSNCGFLPAIDNVPELRRRWGPKLNDVGLFDQASDAFEFRLFSEERLPEHVPFFVYALWEIVAE